MGLSRRAALVFNRLSLRPWPIDCFRDGVMERTADLDFDSTLIRRGRNALSMSEMVQFVETLEARPLIKLMEELPELARLSEAKFTLAMKTLRRRFRGESVPNQMQLRVLANEIADSVRDLEASRRVRALFTA